MYWISRSTNFYGEDSLRGAYVDASVNLEISLMRQRLRMGDQEIARVREELQNATLGA